MELLGRIDRKKIYYIQVRNNPNWKFDLPKNDWIAFTIANNEDEELIPPVVKICIDNNVSYTSSSGEFAHHTEDYFDEEISWRAVDYEIRNKKEFDSENFIVTIANEDFDEAFWFTSLVPNDNYDIDKIICIDFTKQTVKTHLIELIEKINNGFLLNEEVAD